MTLIMFWKAPTVEGVLDGSMDPTGVVLKPRVVEVRLLLRKATSIVTAVRKAIGCLQNN